MMEMRYIGRIDERTPTGDRVGVLDRTAPTVQRPTRRALERRFAGLLRAIGDRAVIEIEVVWYDTELGEVAELFDIVEA